MDQEIKMAVETVRDPASIPLITYVWVMLLAGFGCVVRVLRELQNSRKSLRKILFHFIAELLTSCFAGLLTFWLCKAGNVDPFYTAIWTSVAGWMGVRTLTAFESLYKLRFGAGK